MNFRVNINICRVCMKSEQGVSLLEETELQTKFVFTTRLQLDDDDMPSLICPKCVTRLKIAHDFVQLAHDSDKNLKAFLAKISKDFQQVTRASPDKFKVDVAEEDEEFLALELESEEPQKSHNLKTQHKQESQETSEQKQTAVKRKASATKKSPSCKQLATKKAKLAADDECVAHEDKEEIDSITDHADTEDDDKTKIGTETELSLEMEAVGTESYVKFGELQPLVGADVYTEEQIANVHDLEKDNFDGKDEGSDEESQAELEILEENLQQTTDEEAQNADEQTGEQPLQQQQPAPQTGDGFLKEYEAMLQDGDEFLDDVDNENAMDEPLNLYENTESILPEQEDYTMTEVLEQTDAADDESAEVKQDSGSESQSTSVHPVLFHAVKADAKPKTRKSQSNRSTSSSSSKVNRKSERERSTALLNTRYFCFECNRDFSTKTNLTRHMGTHGGNRPYQCNVCGKGFTQNASLKQHMYTHTGEKPYVCEICNRGFTQCKSLVFHIRRHTGEKPFPCTKCGISFRQKDGLKIHILRHHTITKSDGTSEIHTCIICKKVMEDKYSLQAHMKKHVNNHTITSESATSSITQNSDDMLLELIDDDELLTEKPVLLSDTLPLNMDEISSSTYVVDVMTTSASEPARAKKFQCRKCFKCFALKKSLIRHLWIHDVPAAEQLQCRMCNITFDTPEALQAHDQSEHKPQTSDNKLYECEVCQVIIESAAALSEHINAEHELICPECPNLQFTSQKLLMKHMMEHELNEP